MSVREENAQALLRIMPFLRDENLRAGQAFKLKAPPFMDLNVNILQRTREGDTPTIRLSLAHNYVQEGDLMCDPDMEIRLRFEPEGPVLIACTYQQSALGKYQNAFADGVENKSLSRRLDVFLALWLRNLEQQGHKLAPEAKA